MDKKQSLVVCLFVLVIFRVSTVSCFRLRTSFHTSKMICLKKQTCDNEGTRLKSSGKATLEFVIRVFKPYLVR